ncbi:MAG: pyridoxamine 5'-phosphate oxidase family protein [Patescibacteria group bacterium]|nr:pyridoxamine 5'-phosphate oxidase family protein [Patescibacteria group bacterium]
METLKEIQALIESNPVALATVTAENKPNVIGVAFVKVVSENQVLVTDNYMNQTLKDLAGNNNVCLLVWDKELKGCKLIGQAEYHADGEWKKFVEQMEDNKGLPAKGAILISVSKIIPSR